MFGHPSVSRKTDERAALILCESCHSFDRPSCQISRPVWVVLPKQLLPDPARRVHPSECEHLSGSA